MSRRTQTTANAPLAATDAADMFVFDIGADTGQVSLTGFGRNDVLSTTAKLFDSNNDGIVTFGRDGKLGLDGPQGGDTVDLPGLERYGLRYIGEADGLHHYADARVRPLRAKESRTDNETMAGDRTGRQQDVHFFDTALGLDFGSDRVTRFDSRDLLVTTTRVGNANIGDRLELVDGSIALGVGLGDVRLTGMAGEAIDQLEYRGGIEHAGVTYHVYARIGSTAGAGDLRFVDGGAPSVVGPVLAAATEDGLTVSIDLLSGAKAGSAGGPLKIMNLGTLPDGLVQEGSVVSIDPGNAAFQSLAAGEWRTIDISYRIADNGGSSVAQSARITVSGVNDAPVVDADLSAQLVEDDGVAFIDLLTGASDVDDGDSLSVAGLPELPAGIRLDGDQLRVDLDDPAFQSLAAGDTIMREISFFVADKADARIERTLDLTVTGINDAPVVIGTIEAEADTDDAPFTLDLLAGASDVDVGDRLVVQGVSGLTDGMRVDGTELTIDPTVFTDLAAGEERSVTVQWTVVDGQGGEAARSATIVITGVGGDAPPSRIPTITGFSQDSGRIGDNLTNDATPTLTGTAGAGERVTVSIDGKTVGTTHADTAGRWSYNAVSLVDGAYDFGVRTAAGDGTGLTLTIDTVAPDATASLARSSDTGTTGDGRTSAGSVTIVGTAEAGARVKVGSIETTAGANGAYVANGVDLALGNNAISIVVTDAAGNASTTTLDVERMGDGSSNIALQWNKIALQSIARDGDIPVEATRMLAMVSIAAYDVLNAIDGSPALLVSLDAPDGVSGEAALAAAMAAVISYSYPGQASIIATALADTMATLNLGTATSAASIAFGRDIGEAVIAVRDSDGWDAFNAYESGDAIGQWRPTGPNFGSAEAAQWGDLTPFLIASGDQFRAGPPPALNSAQYAADYNEVKSLGAVNSTTRTADQTQVARFWADGLGSYTPGGHWGAIAGEAAAASGFGLTETARMFAMLNISLADSGIAGWDTKYSYATWRPVTAIQNGDVDGNDATVGDPNWQPLALTPSHPDYVSGHSTYSTAAATILSSIFGDDYAFSTTSLTAPGITRSFDNFQAAANEAGRSRVYGGIHTESSNAAGRQIGQSVANFVLGAFDTSSDARAPTIIVQAAKGLVAKDAPSLSGFAVDNLPGLSAISVALDDGGAKTVAVTGGRFAFDPDALFGKLTEGTHKLTLSATDAAGNVGSASYQFTVDATAPTIVASLSSGTTLTSDTRFVGTADGTGSKIVSLGYAIDGSALRTVSFDPSGGFDTAIDLASLSPGAHTIRITATDASGLTTSRDFTATLTERVAFAVEAITPFDGAGEVGVTFKPEVRFTRAADAASLTGDSFYATDASGTKLPATIVVSADGMRAYLLFDSALPGASRIELHLDGDRIKARGDGVALDGDANGTAGGDLLTDFTTVSRSVVTGTSITGVVVGPGADLKPMTFDDFRVGPDQAANTKDDIYLEKIAGARVWVIGQEGKAVFTAADGSFTLTGVPSGNVKLAIDGRTSTNAPNGYFYPEMVMDLNVRPGVANTVMGTMGSTESQIANIDHSQVYLPRISSASLTAIDDDEATTISVKAEGTTGLTTEQQSYVKLVVQPGSLVDKDGNAVDAPTVGIATVPPELVRDMLPAGLLQHTFDITIQAPDAALFTAPAELTLPNVFNAAPGTKLNVLSFDHDTGRLVINGTATVSADGKFAVTDPGSGVTKPGWHGLATAGSQVTGPSDPYVGEGPGPIAPPVPPPPNCKFGEVAEDLGFPAARAVIANVKAFVKSVPILKIASIAYKTVLVGSAIYNLDKTVQDARSAMSDGEVSAAELVSISSNLLKTKNSAKAAYDELLETVSFLSLLRDQAIALDETISFAEEAIQKIYESECAPDVLKTAAFALQAPLGNAKFLIEQFREKLSGANSSITSLGWDFVCKQIERTLGDINSLVNITGGSNVAANGILMAASAASPDSPPTLQQIVDDLAAISSGLDDDAVTIEELEKDVSASEKNADAIDQLNLARLEGVFANAQRVVEGMPQNAYVLIEYNDDTLRLRTDANGHYEAFLPAETEFVVRMYDVQNNRVGEFSGKTAVSGAETKLPLIMFTDGDLLPDRDGDGLADEAELILGTDADGSDSDKDGLTDLVEAQLGTNPLGDVPLATGVVASLALDGQATDLATLSDFASYVSLALVATGSAGLAIVDVSNPLAPKRLASVDVSGTVAQIAADRQLGMVAVSTGSAISLIDINDPTKPVVLRTVGSAGADIVALDGTIYVATGRSVTAFDMVTGEELQALALGSGNVVGLALENNLLAAVDSSGVAYAIDVSSELMVRKGSVSLGFTATGDGADKIYLANGVLYVPATNGFQGGYGTSDFSDPTKPVVLSGPDDTSFAGSAIALNGSGRGIIVGNPGGVFGANVLDVVDTGDPTATGTFVTRVTLPSAPSAVVIDRGFALVANGTSGLQVVNYLALDRNGEAPDVTLATAGLDVDPNAVGIQVLEGSVLRLNASVTDDVQVRDVSVLVNGTPVDSDGSYPFDLSVDVPTLGAKASDTLTIQVRATDTGGNIGLSDTVQISVVRDTIAPKLVASNLADGALLGQTFRTFRLSFSEPLDQDAVTTAAFRVQNADGTSHTPTNLLFKDGGRTVQLTFDTFDVGNHRFIVDQNKIVDRAGNALGSSTTETDFRVQTFTIEWIRQGSGDWNTASNWSTGKVPQETDEVFIQAAGDAIIRIAGSPVKVARLVTTEAIKVDHTGDLTVISGGSLAELEMSSNAIATFDAATTVGTLAMPSGTLKGDGAVTVDNLFTWTGGTLAGTGDLTVADDATLVIGHSANRSNSTLYLQKDLTLAGAGTFDQGQLYLGTYRYDGEKNAWVNSPGSLTIADDATLTFSGEYSDIYDGTAAWVSNERSSITNAGALVREGNGTTTITSSLINNGAITVQAGTLTLSGGGTGTGSLTVDGGAALEFGGGTINLGEGVEFTADGTLRVTSGTVTIDETLDLTRIEVSGGTLVLTGNVVADAIAVTGGTLKIDGALTVDAVSVSNGALQMDGAVELDTLTVSSGTLRGDGAVMVDTLFVWTGGTLAGKGGLTVAADATLDMGSNGNSSQNALYLQKDVVLEGTGTFDKGQLYLGTYGYDGTKGAWVNTPGSLTISDDAILTFSGEHSDIYDGTASWVSNERSSIINIGTLVRNGDGVTTISSRIAHEGAATVEAGTLLLSGGGKGNGSITVEGSAALQFGGGDFTLGDRVAFAQSASLAVTSGTVTIDGQLSLEQIDVAGGALSLTSNVTVDGIVISGGTLEVDGDVQANVANVTVGVLQFDGSTELNTLSMNGGTLRGDAAVAVGDRFTWTGGTLAGAGDLTVAGDATLDMGYDGNSYNTLYLHKDLKLDGTGTLDKAQLYLGTYGYDGTKGTWVNTPGSLTIADGATLTLSGEYSDIYEGTAAWVSNERSTVNNGGTLVRDGSGVTTITSSITNDGTVRVETGVLLLSGGGNGDGSISIEANATLQFGGGDFALAEGVEFTADGTLRVTSGTVTIDEALLLKRIEVSGGALVLTGNVTVDDIAVAGGTLEIDGIFKTNQATVTGGLLQFDGSAALNTLSVSGGTLRGDGAVAVGDLFTWTGGTLAGTGGLTVAGDATLDMGYEGNGSYSALYLQKDLVLDGTGTLEKAQLYLGTYGYDGTENKWLNSPGSLTIADGASLTFFGEYSDIYEGTASWVSNERSLVINAGTLVRDGDGTTTVTSGIVNDGAITVKDGALLLSGGGTGDGSIAVEGEAELQFGGGEFTSGEGVEFTADGTLRVIGGTVTIDETLSVTRIEVTGGTLVLTGDVDADSIELNGGTLDAKGALSVDVLSVRSGTLQGDGVVKVAESLTWTGGTLAGSGDLTVVEAATLDIGYDGDGSYSTLYLQKNLVLEGEGTLSQGQLYLGTYRYDGTTNAYVNLPGSLTIGDGATLSLSGEFSDIYEGTASWVSDERSLLVNEGTLLRTGEGTSTISAVFENRGTVTIEDGTLDLTGGGAAGGSFKVEDAGELEFGNGTFLLSTEFRLSGSGSVEIGGGDVTFASKLDARMLSITGGTLNVESALVVDTLSVSGGTLQGDGAVSVDDLFAWTAGTLAGSGDLTIGENATLDMGADGNGIYSTLYLYKDLVLAGEGTFEKGQLYLGTYRYDGAEGMYINTPGSLTVAKSAALTLSGEYSDLFDGTASWANGEPSSFTNAGTLVRRGDGTSTIADALYTVHSGETDVEQGYLYVNWDLTI
ncbi:Ig-like domain-containing protein [Sphingomonas sp. SAFR-052]|uniref:Ig-like domain-containing protein n=1 Tax=Sphingomonas sp. SAFR-052 TaxID=3436867 RepID=UPI003F7EC0D2